MDSKVHVQLIFLCVVNLIFSCAGMFLNLLVIVSFWRSSAYLRRKLSYFTIMVLSIFDFLVVITNYPILIPRMVLLLKEKNDVAATLRMYGHFSDVFIGFSVMALLVMSIERYVGAYYPFFHRTSLTKRKLLRFLSVLMLVPVILGVISLNNVVISYPAALIIFLLSAFPPFLFFNYKLFMISRKVRRDMARRRANTSLEVSTLHVNLKNISTCLLAVGCLLLMYIPTFSFIAFSFVEKSTSENTVVHFWAGTLANANSTLNCLIFFWRNDVLRSEGVKAIKALKDRLKCTC